MVKYTTTTTMKNGDKAVARQTKVVDISGSGKKKKGKISISQSQQVGRVKKQ